MPSRYRDLLIFAGCGNGIDSCEQFQLASTVAVTSFIVSFGIVKAVTNHVSGQLADSWGRKKTLVLGWVGLPLPFLSWAPEWRWIVAANVLLGINQGLSWSMTVIMKVDLVGPRRRGLAVGLNEFPATSRSASRPS